MAKPWVHAVSSAKKFGGKPDDYLEIHVFLDRSKGAIADNRHRALTHTSWFIMEVLPRVFGETFRNSDDKVVSTRDVGEQHVIEDLGCIPTPQDYLQLVPVADWMNGRGRPPSAAGLAARTGDAGVKYRVVD